MTAPRVQVEIAATNMAGQTLQSVAQQVKELGEDVKKQTAAFNLGTLSAKDYKEAMAATAAQVRAVAQSAGAGNAQLVPLAGILEKTATSSGIANGGLNTIKAGLTSLTTQALGASGAVGTVGQSLLTLGAGTPIALGIVAGIAAITLAYQKFTSEAREATQRTDEFIAKQVQAARLQANPNADLQQGAVDAATRLVEARKDLATVNRSIALLDEQGIEKNYFLLNQQKRLKKEIADADIATRQTTVDFNLKEIAAGIKRSQDNLQDLNELKQIAAERDAAAAKASATQKKLYDDARKLEETRQRLIGGAIFGGAPQLSGVTTTTPTNLAIPTGRAPGTAETPATLGAKYIDKTKADLQDKLGQLGIDIAAGMNAAIQTGLVDGIVNGIDKAIKSGSIGAGFKAFAGTLLSGIGSAMKQFGKAAIAFAIQVDVIKKFLFKNPLTALAGGIALVAIGSALEKAGGSIFGGADQAAGGAGSVGTSAGASASAVASGSNGTVTVVWPKDAFANPSDPTFQDFFAETIKQLGATRQLVIVTA